MGTIVLHAGMPKAGSTSIQSWLAADAVSLRDQGVRIAVATDRGSHQVRVIPYESGSVLSGDFLYGYLGFGRDAGVLGRFIDGLDQVARDAPITVVSAEGFANFFAPLDAQFVGALDQLASSHDVRVAYYVRPQHTSMEAAWRQWGFRIASPPSEYLEAWAAHIDYLATLDAVREVAPRVRFEVRPFRPDLLLGGEVVTDFSRHFLGVEPTVPATHENEGLSLDVVNILRSAPPGLLWDTPHDNRRLDRLRPILNAVDLPPSAAADRSKVVLQAHCHHRFEPGNRTLIDRLAWATPSFVPPVAAGGADPLGTQDLSVLDALWSEPDDALARQLLFGVLASSL